VSCHTFPAEASDEEGKTPRRFGSGRRASVAVVALTRALRAPPVGAEEYRRKSRAVVQ
jgi:hypothetical protein